VSARGYDLHGVRLVVASDSVEVGEAIHGRLRHFSTAAGPSPDISIEVRVTGREGRHAVSRPRGAGRPVYESAAGEVLWFGGEEILYIDAGERVRATASVPDGRVVISATEAGPDDIWLLSRPLVTLPLIELLKARGLFSVHAAGAVRDGRAIVLPGSTGAGKSTLAVALARAGLEYLGDDMLFLSSGSDGLRVHGLPDEADVSPETASWFPELAALRAAPPDGWKKHRLRLEDVFPSDAAEASRPGLVVFPSIGGVGDTRIAPMPGDAALVELAPNVLLTDPGTSQAHLDALAQLVAESRCFQLDAGRDFDRIVKLLLDTL
jgi:hypothetical protein